MAYVPQVRQAGTQVSLVITRSMITVGKVCNNGKQWVTLKDGGKRIGVLVKGHPLDRKSYTWRELGFNQHPHLAKSKNEAIARLLLRINGGNSGNVR